MRQSFFAKFIVLNVVLLFGLLLGLSLFLQQPSVLLSFVKHRDLWLVDKTGKIQSSNTTAPLPIDLQNNQIPREKNSLALFPGYQIERLVGVERLDNGTQSQFLVFQRKGRSLAGILWLCFLTFSPLVAIYLFVCGFVLFRYFKRNEKMAQSVLTDLRSGKLASRFPIARLDEAGRLMHQFNEMAAEVESVVGKLNVAQRLKGELLRELAHDIKTPLTAIMLQLETVADAEGSMTPSEVGHRMELLIQEMHFFRYLLEDLFLISQMDEPEYQEQREALDLPSLAKSEVLRAQDRGANLKKDIRISLLCPEKIEGSFNGDPSLLKRMLQNALQNALEQAKSYVRLEISVNQNGDWEIIVCDDGLGFSTRAIEEFGRKRNTGLLDISGTGKVSLGLGSVIISKITARYGGSVRPSNRVNQAGQIIGGQLTITLPSQAKPSQLKKAA